MKLIIANTIIGKKGNIGMRLSKLINCNEAENIEFIARGIDKKNIPEKFQKKIKSNIFVSIICRGINYIRRYVYPKFNSRKIDIFIFNLYFLYVFQKFYENRNVTKVLLVESSAYILKFLKSRNIKVVLDLPIAPQTHIKDLKDRNYKTGLIYINWLSNQEEFCMKNADKIITPSKYIYKIAKSYNNDVCIIPFGSDSNNYSEKIFNNKKNIINIGFLGNISLRKGCNYMISSWLNYKKDTKTNHQFTLQGKLYPEFSYVNNSNHIKYREFGDIDIFFNEIDLLILPSYMEGSAKVIYESISRNTPVYTTKFSGAPYFDNIGLIEIEVDNYKFSDIFKHFRNIDNFNTDYVNSFKSTFSWDRYASEVITALD